MKITDINEHDHEGGFLGFKSKKKKLPHEKFDYNYLCYVDPEIPQQGKSKNPEPRFSQIIFSKDIHEEYMKRFEILISKDKKQEYLFTPISHTSTSNIKKNQLSSKAYNKSLKFYKDFFIKPDKDHIYEFTYKKRGVPLNLYMLSNKFKDLGQMISGFYNLAKGFEILESKEVQLVHPGLSRHSIFVENDNLDKLLVGNLAACRPYEYSLMPNYPIRSIITYSPPEYYLYQNIIYYFDGKGKYAQNNRELTDVLYESLSSAKRSIRNKYMNVYEYNDVESWCNKKFYEMFVFQQLEGLTTYINDFIFLFAEYDNEISKLPDLFCKYAPKMNVFSLSHTLAYEYIKYLHFDMEYENDTDYGNEYHELIIDLLKKGLDFNPFRRIDTKYFCSTLRKILDLKNDDEITLLTFESLSQKLQNKKKTQRMFFPPDSVVSKGSTKTNKKTKNTTNTVS